MKKIALACLTAVAAVTLMFAASDKINIFTDGMLSKCLFLSDIESITYENQGTGDNKTHMNVNFTNGMSELYSLDELGLMQWQPSRGECSVTVNVTPRYQSAKLDITAPEGVYYRISAFPESVLYANNFDESIWSEVLMQTDIQNLYATAEQMGHPLSYYGEDEVFEHGNQVRDWFPSSSITDATPIFMIVYTAKLEGDEVVPTSDPEVIRFTTQELIMQNVDFHVTADLKSNAITAKADAPEGYEDMPFYVAIYPKASVEENGMEALANQTALSLEQSVYNYHNGNWDEVVGYGHAENTLRNVRLGEEYYAVAFGLDYGIVTTYPVGELFTIPEPEIVDDCQFDVTASQLSPSEFNISVTPSNNDTRYTAYLIETSRFDEVNTPSMAIARELYYLEATNTIDWDDSEFIVTGAHELNTHNNVLEGKYLNVGTEYSILVFGVDSTGERTTEFKRVDFTPQSQAAETMTFDVSFSNFQGSSKWTHMLTANVKPSNPDGKYVFVYLPENNSFVDLTKTDEQLINDYVAAQGEYLELHQGELTKTMSFGSVYDSEAGDYVFKNYVLMVFGYEGEATTPLNAWIVNAATGETTQVRGPQEAEPLTFQATPGAINASSNWAHYLPMTVTPSDNDAKYVFAYFRESSSYVDLNKTDEQMINDYVAAQGEYLELHQGVLEKTMSFSSDYDSSAGGYVFKPYILMIFGYDGEATSELHLYKIDTNTGTLEQLRGPGM